MASKMTHPPEDRLECAICLSEFADPRMLPCRHTLCKECIEHLVSVSGPKFRCPSCRCELEVPRGGVSGFPKNVIFGQLIELLRGRDTSSAQPSGRRECDNAKHDKEAHGMATAFCTNCAEFFCETCVAWHKRFAATANHKLSSAATIDRRGALAAKGPNANLNCGEHKELKLEFYCDTCHIPTCSKCCLLTHRLHQFRDLATVGREYWEKLEELVQGAGGHVVNLGQHLEELQASACDIRKDIDKARQQVKQAADAMRDIVTVKEHCLLQQIENTERNAVSAVNSALNNTQLKRDCTARLLSYMQALRDSSDVPGQIIRTPVLKEQLRQQQAAPLRAISWTACFKKEANSSVGLSAMLGAVTEDHRVMATPDAATGGRQVKLGQPLGTLRLSWHGGVSGLVVVKSCVCAVAGGTSHLYIRNTVTNLFKTHAVNGLQEAAGLTAMDSDTGSTLVIADTNKRLHCITFDQRSLKITKHVNKSLLFEPCHISVHPVTGEMVIADNTNVAIVLCDLQKNVQRTISVQADIGVMHCVVVLDHGYAVLDWNRHKVHLVNNRGSVTHIYGHRGGENLASPCHMVRANQRQLVVADTENHRLHLLTNGWCSGYPLAEADGIQYPECLWLDEARSLLYVAHAPFGRSGQREIWVYEWPTTAPDTDCNPVSIHKMQVTVGTF